MDVRNPGWGMPKLQPDAPGAVLDLEGALRTPETNPRPWPDQARTSFQQALREILNTPAAQDTSSDEPAMLGPPLYGQWYAKQQTVPVADGLPHWFRELNLDPRYRVAAGLGTSVVRYEQEQLMASAWDQLAKQEQDNQRLKRAQLAEAVGEALIDKHLQRLRPERFLQVTGPVHRAIARGFATADVSAQFLPVPRDHPALSSAFRRLTRPTGPVARRMNRMNPIGQGAAARDVLKGMGTVAALAPQASTPNAVRFEMQAMKTMILAQLEPKVTVLEAVRREAPSAVSTDLIRFAPEFSQPMYEPLRDYFQGMLLPGLDQVPANSIALLETNQKFIEAYMVGPQSRNEPRTTLARISDRPARNLLPAVLGCPWPYPAANTGGTRQTQGHHLDCDVG